ncbi:MAG TPA: two-component sensor histidine kinase, partial [Eubacteriaceae bacterium]|nr:two-component sensor histidine kinase [Eubacteriaceae bacterium]
GLVSDLLDLSKYENTEFQMIFADVHLSELIEEVVQQMRIKANKFNVEIACNHPDLPVVKADRDRLKQVLINILDNAIQYSYAEGVIKVVSALSQDEESVEISIRDFGPGIDPKKKDRIFEAFYRMEEDRSRQAGGSGLGLAISKDIIEKHHGTISVESQIDEGTLITITLPLS